MIAKYIQIVKSKLQDKKYTAKFYDAKRVKIKTVHFGAAGMSDYTKHKDEERKYRYLARHKANENWNNPMSSGALSRWFLWNKPSLSASFNDFIKKFNLSKY